MVIISMNKKEFLLVLTFLILFIGSFIVMKLPKGNKLISVPVIALEEYLIHEGVYYQRTLSIVTLIDIRLTLTNTHYEGRPLYKESNEKFPERLLWPIDQNIYTVFVKIKN